MVSANNGINNTVGATISGATNTLTVTNGSNTASSAANCLITVGGSSSADPTLQHSISGVTTWTQGIDNSASDAFKLSASAALGTTDTFIMTTAGERTMPLQPSFRAYLSATQNNVTGDGTSYPIIFNTEIFDQNSDYDNTNGTFTAPVTGRYLFFVNIFCQGITAAMSSYDCSLYVNSVLNSRHKKFAGSIAGDAVACSTIIPLTALDVVHVTVALGGGTKTADVLGNSTDTFFCGCLLV